VVACYAWAVDYMLGVGGRADVEEVVAVLEPVPDLELQVVTDG